MNWTILPPPGEGRLIASVLISLVLVLAVAGIFVLGSLMVHTFGEDAVAYTFGGVFVFAFIVVAVYTFPND